MFGGVIFAPRFFTRRVKNLALKKAAQVHAQSLAWCQDVTLCRTLMEASRTPFLGLAQVPFCVVLLCRPRQGAPRGGRGLDNPLELVGKDPHRPP
jgi:hypothetical protein